MNVEIEDLDSRDAIDPWKDKRPKKLSQEDDEQIYYGDDMQDT